MSNTDEINKEYGELKPWEYALFIQSTKWFFDEKFKIQGALRYDNSDSYAKYTEFFNSIENFNKSILTFFLSKASLNPSIVLIYMFRQIQWQSVELKKIKKDWVLNI